MAHKMTREEMVRVMQREMDIAKRMGRHIQHQMDLADITAELRKTCLTCQHFKTNGTLAECRREEAYYPGVPADGSGFCHQYQPREEGPR